jgi:NNP family nitrate/nitrite transporter-like MFS transporter
MILEVQIVVARNPSRRCDHSRPTLFSRSNSQRSIEVIFVPVPARNRRWVTMAVTTGGYGITFFAWGLAAPFALGPSLWPGLGEQALILLTAAAVLVLSVLSVPVGVLTDRYGGRVVMPALCLALAVPMMGLAVVRPGPGLVAVACAIGVAGTTMAAGAAIVVRAFPRARRGLALSAFGGGQVLAIVGGFILQPVLPVDLREAAPLVALALAAYAIVAAVLLHDRPTGPVPAGWRAAVDVARTPAARQLASWYAVGFGGTMAVFLYLPAFLHQESGLAPGVAALHTAACLVVAGLCRPLGGWLCQHREPRSLLFVCFLVAGALVLLLAFQPPVSAVLELAYGISGCLGVASGVVLALLGATAPPGRAGTAAGVVTGVGGVIGLLPPSLLAAVNDVNGSYGLGLALLAGATLTGAAYLRLKGRWVGTALAFPASIAPGNSETILVAVSTPPMGNQLAQTVAALTSLANHQEMVIVVGGDRAVEYDLVVALRTHLPRHRIVAVASGAVPHRHEVGVLIDLVVEGALPVVLTGPHWPEGVAFLLAEALGAHRVLTATQDRVDGVMLRPPFAPVTTVPVDC